MQRFAFSINDYQRDTTHVEDYALHGNDAGVLRVVLGQAKPYSFRTNSNQKNLPFSFAFYSCYMPYKDTLFGNTDIANIEMWDYFNAVLKRQQQEDLRFVVGGGDQVYVDGVQSLNIWKFLTKVARKEGGEILPSDSPMTHAMANIELTFS